MKLLVVAVGKKMPDWVTTGFNEYSKRMPREARLELVEIKPEPRTSGKNVAQIMEAEAQRILAAMPQRALRVVLDEHGAQLSTRQMSQQLQTWMGSGQDVAFIIGGADGLHALVKSSTKQILAMSTMTLPHGLVRILLAEQLYRAYSLLHNHPYHRQ